MAERISKKSFEELGRSMWRVALIGMPVALDRVRQPSVVSRTFSFPDRMLDLVFDIVPNAITDRPDPVRLEATITAIEPHSVYPDYNFYSYKTLALGLGDRSRYFEVGAYEGADTADLSIQPITQGPYAHVAGHRRPRSFEKVVGSADSRFGQEEVDYFLTNLATFADRLKQDL